MTKQKIRMPEDGNLNIIKVNLIFFNTVSRTLPSLWAYAEGGGKEQERSVPFPKTLKKVLKRNIEGNV